VIVHLGDRGQLDAWAGDVSPAADALAAAFWPGPLTIVVRRASSVLDAVTGGANTVGVRVPDQPVARALLEAFGDGIAAPSANRFGRVSPTTADHVRADLGDDVAVVLDDGPCPVGVESTIVDCSGEDVTILRPGAISVDAVEAIVCESVSTAPDGRVRAPGSLKSHYAPRATVLLVEAAEVARRARDLVDAGKTVAVLALADHDVGVAIAGTLVAREAKTGGVARVTVLDSPGDVGEYAQVLYGRLREVDAQGIDVLLAVPPPETGIGAAVADRLRRAAGREAAG
jgi:L-threonylcarbamoyladenylate synthase